MEVREIKNLDKKLFENISENSEQVDRLKTIAAVLFDKTLSEKNDLSVKNLVEETLDSEKFKDLKRLLIYSDQNRKSILVVGGVASGKGSVTELQLKFLLAEGAVEINPDLYKKLILSDKDIDPKYNLEQTRIFHGSITHDESSIIFDKIALRWADKAKQGKAPNLLMDVCRAGNWIIDTASSGNTNVEIHAANLDTEVALRRSFERGKQTGRMPTEWLLTGHKDQFYTQSNAIKNKNCNLVVYSAENPLGHVPTL